MALTDKLTALGDAIREKNGTTDPMTLDEMTVAVKDIQTSVEMPEDILTLMGDQKYRFYNSNWDSFIQQYGNQIITRDLLDGNGMLYNTKLTHIPFSINFKENDSGLLSGTALNNLLGNAYNLMELPEINIPRVPSSGFGGGINHCFYNCQQLRYIDLDFENMDWDTKWGPSTYGYMGGWGYRCHSLRKIPTTIWHKCQIKTKIPTSNSYSPYYYTANQTYNLDDLCELPVVGTYTSNCFAYAVSVCYRLKDFTFQTQNDGTAYTADWKSQTIDLRNAGYALLNNYHTRDQYLYNSGITIDKCIYDDTTYQALKDDPDNYVAGYSTEMPHYYSRYDKASAIRTINSLPDVSASGGTNTITFRGEAGLKTDGGAINTMTEAEIAVATVKGWTVSFV